MISLKKQRSSTGDPLPSQEFSWKIKVCYETGRLTSYQHQLRGLESTIRALSSETIKRR